MANKKFSDFTAQAPNAATSYLVGYDSVANDNIRFQEGDLNLADMGGTIDLGTQTTGTVDLATQTTGNIDLATQASGALPTLNGGTGVSATNLELVPAIGWKSVASTSWTSGFLNVPRGAEYTLPYNQNSTTIKPAGVARFEYVNFGTTPPGVTQLGAQARGIRMYMSDTQAYGVRVTLRMAFYDQTADLDIQGGFYSSKNTWAGATKYLLIKDSANESVDSRIYEASAYVEVPTDPAATPGSFVYWYFLSWVRFDNGSIDPYPYYDPNMVGAATQFTIEQLW